MKKNVIITGGTSGIGEALVNLFASAGDRVFSLGLENGFDITDENAVKLKVDEIGRECGKIDILINCAGYGLSGATELIPLQDIKKLFEVNFFGLVNMTNCVLKYMSAGSKILNVASAMALLPIPFRAFYGAVKASVANYSLSLRMELLPSCIYVSVVHPGNVATNFTKNRVKHLVTNEKYGDKVQNAQTKNDGRKRMSKEYVAKKIYNFINVKRPKAEIVIGGKYKFMWWMSRRISRDAYCKMASKVAG
ncbi:MAG: SDR family NAD(P)-dependent oxidoreductase [Christensenellaceae bacterium]|jgi:short-subunit dehydrogenase|nr:SDR family NAD(P)-dependent oxidoreductase [Christensenellaceae bacterium]